MPYIYGQLLRAAVETLGSDPSTAADKFTGRLWYNTATNLLKYSDASNNVKVLLTSGDVVNADINASAAIVYSKLNLTGGIVNADVNASAAIVYSKLNLTGGVVNADVNASAAIAYSKLAALTTSRALVSDGSGFVSAATTTATEIGYVNGVTSAIQTQLDAKQARATLTTKGDIYVATGSATVVRQGVGADGTFLKADSGQASGVTWGSISSSRIVQNKAFADSPFTAAATDDVILVDTSGGGFTLNLPAGSTGKIFRITKTTSDFDVVTVDGNGAEAIREGGTSATTTTLNTRGESIELTWNGTLWEVTDRRNSTPWLAYTPVFVGFGTAADIDFQWRRIGDSIEIMGSFTVGTPTGTQARVHVPGGLTSGAVTSARANSGTWIRAAATTSHGGFVFLEDSVTYITFGGPETFSNTSINAGTLQNGDAIVGAGEFVYIRAMVGPIAGWKG